MGIKKQEFYEGAALHLLIRNGGVEGIQYDPPFFTINSSTLVLLKYSTKGRSPWGFSFSPEEQQLLLKSQSNKLATMIGLVCAHDGIAVLALKDYLNIAPPRSSSVHLACYRQHAEHYQVNGPDGKLGRKIPPSAWQKILET